MKTSYAKNAGMMDVFPFSRTNQEILKKKQFPDSVSKKYQSWI